MARRTRRHACGDGGDDGGGEVDKVGGGGDRVLVAMADAAAAMAKAERMAGGSNDTGGKAVCNAWGMHGGGRRGGWMVPGLRRHWRRPQKRMSMDALD